VEHPVKKDMVRIIVSSISTVRELLETVAGTLRRPEVLKAGRIVRRSSTRTHFTSLEMTERIGSRRKFTLMGVDSIHAAPWVGPALTLDQALSLQGELVAAFASSSFQSKLLELESAHGRVSVEFRDARRACALEIQREVLPFYGFQGSFRGVSDMAQAFEAFANEDAIVQNWATLNDLVSGSTSTEGVAPNSTQDAELSSETPTTTQETKRKSRAPRTLPSADEVFVVRTSKRGKETLAVLPSLHLTTSARGDSGGASVFVDSSLRYQTLLGFGGSFTETSANLFWAATATSQRRIIEAYFDAETGLGYRVGRLHINSCDFSTGNWSCCDQKGDAALETFTTTRYERAILPFIRRAVAAADDELLKLVASPWSPPGWMKDTNRMVRGGKLKREYRKAWARFYVLFAQEMEAAGLPLWALSVQNEPLAVTSWENCNYSAEEERDFVRDHLGPALQGSGVDAKLLVYDHNRDEMLGHAGTIYADPRAEKYVWGVGFHWYGDPRYEVWPDPAGQVCFDNVKRVHDLRPDKHLVMMEACQEGGPHVNDWAVGERYAENIINDLNNWTEAWIDWNLLLNMEGGPNHVGNFCSAPILINTKLGDVLLQPSYYYLGHFSRYIRPGAQRILCGANRDALEVTAFANPDSTIAVVVLNRSDADVAFRLERGDKWVLTSAPAHSITTYILCDCPKASTSRELEAG